MVYDLTKKFPTEEKYALVSQIKRSSVSVAANIAEGHPKTLGDYIRHLVIAIGSLHETRSHILVAIALDMCTSENCNSIKAKISEVDIMMTKLIKALEKRKNPLAQ